jgi:hypothetical protein
MPRLCSSLLLSLMVAAGPVASGGDEPKEPRASFPPAPPMCVTMGAPPLPVKYALLKSLLLERQTYGGVQPLTMQLVGQARAVHADAIINYNGAQHFGFWPWRFMRPVVSGDAVRIENPEAFDCARLGGEFYSETGYYGQHWGAQSGEPGESEYERGRREERERIERERGTSGQ